MAEKPCTCHPDDRPPTPCAKQYALLDCLRARIAELETENFKLAAGQCVHPKGIIGDDYGNATCPIADKEPIATGWVIVDESPPAVCYAVHDTIDEAWEARIGEASKHESPEFLRAIWERTGERAVRVAVVKVEES